MLAIIGLLLLCRNYNLVLPRGRIDRGILIGRSLGSRLLLIWSAGPVLSSSLTVGKAIINYAEPVTHYR